MVLFGVICGIDFCDVLFAEDCMERINVQVRAGDYDKNFTYLWFQKNVNENNPVIILRMTN